MDVQPFAEVGGVTLAREIDPNSLGKQVVRWVGDGECRALTVADASDPEVLAVLAPFDCVYEEAVGRWRFAWTLQEKLDEVT
jgi:hypothetical protein